MGKITGFRAGMRRSGLTWAACDVSPAFTGMGKYMSDDSENFWPTRAHLPGRLIGGIYRCRNHFWERDQQVLSQHKLSWAQFLALMALRDEAPDFLLTPSQMSRLMQVTSGGMSKILTFLERRQLITRVENPEDARSHKVCLTPEGKALAEEIYLQLFQTNLGYLQSALSDEECEELARLVRKLSGYLDETLGASSIS